MGLKDTKPNVSAVFVEIYRCIPQVPVFLHKEWNKGTDVLYSNAQFQKCIKNLYADLMYSHSCSLWTLSSITKQPCLSLCYKYTAIATAPVCPPYSISFPSALKTPICKYQWNLVEKLDNDPGCHWLTDAQHPGEVSVSWWKQTRLCRDAPRVEWHSRQHVEYRSAQAQDEGCQSHGALGSCQGLWALLLHVQPSVLFPSLTSQELTEPEIGQYC